MKKEALTVKDVFKEAGYEEDEYINFGLIDSDLNTIKREETKEKILKMRETLGSLKNHPVEEVYRFVEKELEKRKKKRIQSNFNRDKVFNTNKKIDLIEQGHEKGLKITLVKTMKWFHKNVLNN